MEGYMIKVKKTDYANLFERLPEYSQVYKNYVDAAEALYKILRSSFIQELKKIVDIEFKVIKVKILALEV